VVHGHEEKFETSVASFFSESAARNSRLNPLKSVNRYRLRTAKYQCSLADRLIEASAFVR
jgi:hypothetical protein